MRPILKRLVALLAGDAEGGGAFAIPRISDAAARHAHVSVIEATAKYHAEIAESYRCVCEWDFDSGVPSGVEIVRVPESGGGYPEISTSSNWVWNGTPVLTVHAPQCMGYARFTIDEIAAATTYRISCWVNPDGSTPSNAAMEILDGDGNLIAAITNLTNDFVDTNGAVLCRRHISAWFDHTIEFDTVTGRVFHSTGTPDRGRYGETTIIRPEIVGKVPREIRLYAYAPQHYYCTNRFDDLRISVKSVQHGAGGVSAIDALGMVAASRRHTPLIDSGEPGLVVAGARRHTGTISTGIHPPAVTCGHQTAGVVAAYGDVVTVTASHTHAAVADGAPTPGFAHRRVRGRSSLAVQFIDTSEDVTPIAWYWDFGDGETSDERAPVHEYANQGTYTVTFTPFGYAGGTSYTSQVVVKPLPIVQGPVVGWQTSPGHDPENGYYNLCDCGQSIPPAGLIAVAISAGELHSLAIRPDGSVAAWGQTYNGACDVPEGLVAVDVVAGPLISFARRADGSVVAWGREDIVRDGIPEGLVADKISVSMSHGIALRPDGSVVCWGYNSYGQCDVPDGLVAIDVAAGTYVSVALCPDGSVVCWGLNSHGACNVPAGLHAIAIAAGIEIVGAIRLDGSVACWGRSDLGQTTVPENLLATELTCYSSHFMARRPDNTVVAWGWNADGQCDVPEHLVGSALAAGEYHSLAIAYVPHSVAYTVDSVSGDSLGVAFSDVSTIAPMSCMWDFGDGETSTEASPQHTYADPGSYNVTLTAQTATGDSYSYARNVVAPVSDRRVIAWGSNEYGQCDVPESLQHLGESEDVALACGVYHTLALRSDGTVAAWGYNDGGQCDVPDGLVATQIAAGGHHSLALRSDGTVVAWGDNYFGQCDVPAGLTDVVKISGGGFHSMALKSDGTVVCWGGNMVFIGDGPMYSLVVGGQCEVPAGLIGVIDIAAGQYHSVAVRSDRSVVTWGTTDFWDTSYHWDYYASRGLKDPNWMAYGWGIPQHLLAGGVRAVSAGMWISLGWGSYTAFLRTDGNIVFVSGSPYHGPDYDPDYQFLMQIPTDAVVTRVAAGGDSIFALLNDGRVVSFEGVKVPDGLYATDIAAGTRHAVAVGHLPPRAAFVAEPRVGPAALSVQFTQTYPEYQGTSIWDFGDGETAFARDPQHTYTEPGEYVATLTILNPAGDDSAEDDILATPPTIDGVVVRGVVLDATELFVTGRDVPVSGVRVTIGDFEMVTDGSGEFDVVMPDVGAGMSTVVLMTSAPGYVNVQRSLDISHGEVSVVIRIWQVMAYCARKSVERSRKL